MCLTGISANLAYPFTKYNMKIKADAPQPLQSHEDNNYRVTQRGCVGLQIIPEDGTIKIVLADDQTLFRKAIMELLNKFAGFEVIGETADGQNALEIIGAAQPDILLLDIAMTGLDGFGVLRNLQETNNPVKTIVLSMFFEEKIINKAMKAGARGFLPKTVEPGQLLATIKIVNAGNTFIHTGPYNHRSIKKPSTAPEKFFTLREIQVMELLGEGFVSKEIAGRLGLSPRTIEDIRQRLMQKTQCHCVASLITYAYRN